MTDYLGHPTNPYGNMAPLALRIQEMRATWDETIDPGGVGVKERERVTARTDQGDHDRFAHYVLSDDPHTAIMHAMIEGTPIKALCGKVWVPSRDASKFPVCPECKEIKDAVLSQNH